MYNLIIRNLYNLPVDIPSKSGTHLTPHIIITMFLTISPMLYILMIVFIAVFTSP